jgi:hypothetical protein
MVSGSLMPMEQRPQISFQYFTFSGPYSTNSDAPFCTMIGPVPLYVLYLLKKNPPASFPLLVFPLCTTILQDEA